MTKTQDNSKLIEAIKAAELATRKIDFAGKANHSINTQEQARITL